MAQWETGKGVEKRYDDVRQKYKHSNVCIKMNNKHSCSKERTINHDVSSKTRLLISDKEAEIKTFFEDSFRFCSSMRSPVHLETWPCTDPTLLWQLHVT